MTEAPPDISPTVAAFLRRCQSYRQMTGRSEVWLSHFLFKDNKIIRRLREGHDITVTRLERAERHLAQLRRNQVRAKREEAK